VRSAAQKRVNLDTLSPNWDNRRYMTRHDTNNLFEGMDSRFRGNDKEGATGHIIRVAFGSAADREFDYFVPDELWPIQAGQRVEVPFGRKNKLESCFCVDANVPIDKSYINSKKVHPLKIVKKVIDKEPLLNAELMELARWISDYYVCPLGQVLAAMVPGAVKRAVGLKLRRFIFLSPDAIGAAEKLRGPRQKQIISVLKEHGSVAGNSAMEISELLYTVGCTSEIVRNLIVKRIIKVVERETLIDLPVIPEGLSLKKIEKITLNEEQKTALHSIRSEIDSDRFAVTLLHGVTDSGKTELYIRALESVIQKGKTGIVLLPEIALTAQTVQRFSARFERIAVMHSGLTATQRNSQWHKIKSGNADVVIGARSAIFAPLPKLGLVVVDEEHDASYKQDTAPRYNARDVAVKRTQLVGAHCILGSATPSLETLFNCRTKKHFQIVRLPKRVMNLPMPQMKLVDLRQGGILPTSIDLISKPLAARLTEILARKEQAILLLNRRGYSTFIFCPKCKHTIRCHNCDITLTFHRSSLPISNIKTVTPRSMRHGYAICHYCLAQTLVPQRCPLCNTAMIMIGPGSQKLEEELAKKFPQARITRIDSDSMSGRDYYKFLRDFSEGRIDILAGTQILAKGLHFPNVTLVGIISADTALYLPDFRANERTFQLISQVAGRAGRSEKKGTVLVQTYLPDQPAIKFALNMDFEGFVQEELKHRKACNLPPLWRLAVVHMRDKTYEKLEAASKSLRSLIDSIVEQQGLKVVVRGPMPAVISRIQRFHRMQIIVQAPDAVTMHKLFTSLRGQKIRPVVQTAIDIDPVNLL
jgi:primosomal protein N' (replication factor Y)